MEEIREFNRLKGFVDEIVKVIGKFADTPDQHIIDPPAEFPEISWLDLKGGQIVVYTRRKHDSEGEVIITGKVISRQAKSKKPSSTNMITEYQVQAIRIEPVFDLIPDLLEIVTNNIKKNEKLGYQVGGSGHMGDVAFEIEEVSTPEETVFEGSKCWEINYKYILVVTTEFTIYPDNPPYEYFYSKKIIIDEAGNIIKEFPKTGN